MSYDPSLPENCQGDLDPGASHKEGCMGCGDYEENCEDGYCEECRDNYCSCGEELSETNNINGVCQDCF